MKKMLTVAVLMLMIGWITPVFAATNTTIAVNSHQLSAGYSNITIPFTLSDTTNVEKRFLYLGITGSSIPLFDSIYQNFTSPDTFKALALLNGASYTYYLTVRDTTANDSTIIISPQYTFSTTDYTQTIGDSAITFSSAYCYWDSSAADTGIAKVVLITDTANPPTTRQDSSQSSNRVDTSFALTGLLNGVTYYYYFEASDSATVDSSVINSFTTIDRGVGSVEIWRIANDSLFFVFDTTATGLDSAWKSVVVQFGPAIGTFWPREESLTSSITYPDTIPFGLVVRGSGYSYRFITVDSTTTDTSTTYTFSTYDSPYYSLPLGFDSKDGVNIRKIHTGDYMQIEHQYTNSAYSLSSQYIDITGVEWIKFWSKKLGQTANTFDSVYVLLYSVAFGERTLIDTILFASGDVDTSAIETNTYIREFTAPSDTSGAGSYGLKDWGMLMQYDISIADSGTAAYNDTTIGTGRIFIGWEVKR